MRSGPAVLVFTMLVRTASAQAGDARPPAAVTKDVRTDVPRVQIRGARVRAKDILGPAAADVDLGATPPVGASRVIERADIERAYAAANVPAPKMIPSAVRVTRKMRRLEAAEVSAAIRLALDETTLPHNATLLAVRAQAADVPADFERVALDLPPLPRRSGVITVHSPVRLLGEDGATIQRLVVPLEIALPAEAAIPDVAKGASVSLVIRKGLVELTVGAVATADADVGGIVGIMIKPSGRVVRARLLDKSHAVALEDS